MPTKWNQAKLWKQPVDLRKKGYPVQASDKAARVLSYRPADASLERWAVQRKPC